MLHKSIILFALLLSACAANANPEDLDRNADRYPLGKADAYGSCADSDCDGQSDGTCWCDEDCTFFGDCCGDRIEICEAPVSQFCGGLLGQGCNDDEYCHFENDAICGFGDASGTCRIKPDACTAQFAPVCGCNGQSFSNPCMAANGGTTVLHDGACEDEPVVCGPVLCELFCDDGFQTDENGCEVCSCAEGDSAP